MKILEPFKYPKIPNIGSYFIGYLEGSKFFKTKNVSNFYYVFPIYNSKLHDICSTSNLVHPPFYGLTCKNIENLFLIWFKESEIDTIVTIKVAKIAAQTRIYGLNCQFSVMLL